MGNEQIIPARLSRAKLQTQKEANQRYQLDSCIRQVNRTIRSRKTMEGPILAYCDGFISDDVVNYVIADLKAAGYREVSSSFSAATIGHPEDNSERVFFFKF